MNHDASGSGGVKDRKLDAEEDTKNWSVEDVCAYIETLVDGEIAERFEECVTKYVGSSVPCACRDLEI